MQICRFYYSNSCKKLWIYNKILFELLKNVYLNLNELEIHLK